MELTAASTAASAAITLLPGDTATPIAEKLADLSSYFLVVLCAIYLEKYLVTITGYATFMILIPLACVLYSANVFMKSQSLTYLIRKMAVFGLALFLVIPASVKVSNIIEDTYSTSINQTIEDAKETTDEIESNTKQDDEGVFSSIISSVKDGVSNITDKVNSILNNFLEALAIMLVTSCLIPILVLIFFIWLIKMALGIDMKVPAKKLIE